MKRRNFLKRGLGGGALLSVAAPAAAQTAVPLRLMTTEKRNGDALKARVETVTGGGVTLDVQETGLEDASGLLDAVSTGAADMALVRLDAFLDKNLALGMFASMPFGMSATEIEGWITASDGREMLDQLGDELGVSIYLAGNGGVRPIWSKAPITNVSSLLGQKIGSTGLGILSLKAAGANTVFDLSDPSVAWGDLDVIDGASAMTLKEKGLLDTFTSLSTANPNQPTALTALVVNKDTLAGLPDNHALVLDRCCSAELSTSAARTYHEDTEIMNAPGFAATAYDLPDDVWKAVNAGARDVLKDIFDSGVQQATIVDAYTYFLADISKWSEVGEAAYFTGRKRRLST